MGLVSFQVSVNETAGSSDATTIASFDAAHAPCEGIDETRKIKIQYLFHLVMRNAQQCADAALRGAACMDVEVPISCGGIRPRGSAWTNE